ncbi:MAG: hypothetical protein JW885_02920 [Deltaproteobacteria bacterium]|nr:hypothetical protein [Candidatus Zymogenaceae bacterium]
MKNIRQGKILAIDPSSKKTGWALWKSGKYIKSGVLAFDSFGGAVRQCLEVLDSVSPIDALVIEDQYYHMNAKTLKVLAEFAAIFKVLVNARSDKVAIFVIPPATWQAKMLGGGNTKRDERKKRSTLLARMRTGKDRIGEDESDAVNLGEHFTIYGPYTRTSKKGTGKKSAGRA